MQDTDQERRFGGIKRLYGETTAKQISKAHICIAGIGGVGSWSAEALARCGVGEITLIDLDMVAESNTNRQIHALGDEYGKAKVDAMAERILQINPTCTLHRIEDFVTPENVTEIITNKMDLVIDAIDQVRAKAAMINHCRQLNIPIVITGAAGGKTEPTRICCDDLSRTTQDPLLARVRTLLRKEYEFPRPPQKMGVTAIYSTEPITRAPQECSNDIASNTTGSSSSNAPQSGGLNCAGFGSSVCVTAPMGFAAVAAGLKILRP